MSLKPHELELLAPARDTEIAREAIIHGADAIYIGGPMFGARHNASNSLTDIAALVQFAHRYHARVFVTINTILHDSELEPARQLINDLYNAGVDALIVQDMAVLEMDIPPIQLHASTQCDIRSVEKGKFLAEAGFSQLVLPRELTIQQIRQFHDQVDATLEYFVHGALCVAFSGQCYISHAETGRSANRGDCSQACRLPYTLKDSSGAVVAFDKHLLSMKDNNQSANLEALIDAGIRSFKIEGRYKDMAYVKNITAHYRQLLDQVMERRPEFKAASSGKVTHLFTPDPDRNFNRGSTDYFANGRQEDIGAFDSPKFMGQEVGTVIALEKQSFLMEAQSDLHNGDGLTYMNKRQSQGIHVNRAEKVRESGNSFVYRISPRDGLSTLAGLKTGATLYRNRDQAWDQSLVKKSAERQIEVSLSLTVRQEGLWLKASDEDGVKVELHRQLVLEPSRQGGDSTERCRQQLAKLGGTDFVARAVQVDFAEGDWFVPVSAINDLRRETIDALMQARLKGWQRPERKPSTVPAPVYPETSLSFLANIYNKLARRFYEKHGVQMIAAAYEAHEEAGEVPVMITKHCLRFSFNLCPKQAKGVQGVQGQVKAEPMTLVNGDQTYTLKFDCKPCEMHIMGKMRKDIFKSAPPSVFPIEFHPKL